MIPNERSILLDQDGVLADTMGTVLDVVQYETGVSLCHADIKDYWFKGLEVEPRFFLDALKCVGLYRNLGVMTGAVRAVNRLRETYHDNIFVVTAPMKGCEETCEVEKREWLAEHFDVDFAERAIVTQDKTEVLGRVLVEDNPDIPRTANWQPILFDQPWNRHVPDLPVMRNWGDLTVIEANYAQV